MEVRVRPPRGDPRPTCPKRLPRRWPRSSGTLLRDRSLERCHLGLAQHPPPARLQPPKLEWTETDAIQRLHLVADEMQHPAHLAVPALTDDDADLGDT